MINRIKRDLVSLYKIHKSETVKFLLISIIACTCKYTFEQFSFFILIIGLIIFFTPLLSKKIYIDKYKCFLYTKPFFSDRYILFQDVNKRKYDCQEVMASLLSKKKVKETISKLPKGNYKSITHSSLINAIMAFDNDISISGVVYNDKLSEIRKRLLGKKCPCSDDVDCKYRKYILSSQEHKDTIDFYYIEFTIK